MQKHVRVSLLVLWTGELEFLVLPATAQIDSRSCLQVSDVILIPDEIEDWTTTIELRRRLNVLKKKINKCRIMGYCNNAFALN